MLSLLESIPLIEFTCLLCSALPSPNSSRSGRDAAPPAAACCRRSPAAEGPPSQAAACGVGGVRRAIRLGSAAVLAHPLRAGAGHPARLRQPRLALRPSLRPPRPAPRRPPLRPCRPRVPARPPPPLHRRRRSLHCSRRPHRRLLRGPRPPLWRRHHPGFHTPRSHPRLPHRLLALGRRQQRHAGALQGLPRGPHRSVTALLLLQFHFLNFDISNTTQTARSFSSPIAI
jgi:hypothetical protein